MVFTFMFAVSDVYYFMLSYEVGCLNHRLVTMVADKLNKLYLSGLSFVCCNSRTSAVRILDCNRCDSLTIVCG